jgi:putative FmdB family regulatory protein
MVNAILPYSILTLGDTMPVYAYICQNCNGEFEKRVGFSDTDQVQECPSCGSKNSRKRLSLFATKNAGIDSSSGIVSSSCGNNGRFT